MYLKNREKRNYGYCRIRKSRRQFAAVFAALCSITTTAQAEPLSLQQTLLDGVNGIDFIERPDGLAVTEDRVHVVSTFEESLNTFQRDAATGQLTLLNAYHFEFGVTPLPAFEAKSNIVNVGANRVVLSAVVHDCYEDSCRGVLELVTLDFDASGSPNIISRSDNFGSVGQSLVVSPDNRHLYELGSTIGVYNIGDDGFVQEVERYRENNLDDERVATISNAHFTPDGEYIIAMGESGGWPYTIATFERDTSSGRISLTQELILPDSIRIGSWLTLSPDGQQAYLFNPAEEDNDRNIGRYAVNTTTGEVTFVDYYDVTNEVFPGSLTRSDDVAISSNGRMLIVYDEGEQPGRIHLYTVDDSGALTHRGFEEAGRDGVTEDNLFVMDTDPVISPDDAHLYMAARFKNSVSTFAIHADMQVDIEQVPEVIEGTTASTTIALFNAGPATAHGINVQISASESIANVGSQGNCSLVSDVVAVCQIDELRAMVPLDIVVDTVAPTAGEQVSISVEQTQYQVDLEPSDNSASASYLSIEEEVVDPDVLPADTDQESSGGGAFGLLLFQLLLGFRVFRAIRLS